MLRAVLFLAVFAAVSLVAVGATATGTAPAQVADRSDLGARWQGRVVVCVVYAEGRMCQEGVAPELSASEEACWADLRSRANDAYAFLSQRYPEASIAIQGACSRAPII